MQFLCAPLELQKVFLGAHEAYVKKIRYLGKNVYYEKWVCATDAVDAADAAYAAENVVKSVPKAILVLGTTLFQHLSWQERHRFP